MTLVHVRLHVPVPTGEAPARLSLVCTPMQRHHLEDPDRVVLPEPFRKALDALGEASIELAGGWYWQVFEDTGAGITRTFLVPDQAEVDYGDLTDIDPATLDPATSPSPAWLAALADEASTREAADVALGQRIDTAGAVQSVNGQVGAVDLDAADVGADPAGAAAAITLDGLGGVRHGLTTPAENLRAWGHSYLAGSTTSVGGSSLGTSDMATLMAQGLGLPLVQSAVSGATLHTAASSGDWGDILQGEIRSSYGSYKPFGGAWVVMYGINDAARIGHTYTELAPFRASLRAVVSRFRAMSVFEDNSPTIAKTGTWLTNSATNRNSGSTYAYSNVAGSTITWTPPGVFPGGTVSFVLSAYGDGGSALWTATVNRVDYTHNTASYALAGNNPTTGILRIPNVPRNTASITLTLSSVSATGAARAMFDCVMVEAPTQASGVVALIGQPKPLDYTSQAGAPAGPVTDNGVDVINQIIQEISTEFGPRVVYVDTSVMDSSPSYFEAGNIHPNGAGHAYIAAQTVAAIQSVVEIVPAPNLSLGTTAGTAADGGALTTEISRAAAAEALLTPTTDPRLSNARTPLAHQHSTADVTAGVLDPARLGTGTADASMVLHGDSTWAPAAASSPEVRSASTDTYSYMGQAPVGTAESATGWTLTRIALTGTVGATTHGTGSWTNHESAVYS